MQRQDDRVRSHSGIGVAMGSPKIEPSCDGVIRDLYRFFTLMPMAATKLVEIARCLDLG
jgi:hypothetical protein